MSWTNYHSHCNYCDGKEQAENYIKKAIELGLKAYGYSSHAPIPFETFWTMKAKNLASYKQEIEGIKQKYADQIQVYCGLEIDFIPDLVGPQNGVFTEYDWDYTIGSLHFTSFFKDGNYCNIDGSHKEFLKGLDEIYKGNIKEFIKTYYDVTRQMIDVQCPDIVGHLDKIKMHNINDKLFFEKEDWYQQEVFDTLKLIKEKDVIVEVNTRGYYQNVVNGLYPSRWVLEEMKKLEIPVMINSDSHKPEEILLGYDFAAKNLLEIGYTTLRVLLDSKWQDVPFDKSGLIF